MSKYCAVQLRVPVRVTVLSNSTAAAVVAAAVAVAVASKRTTMCGVLSLHCLACLSLFPFSLSAPLPLRLHVGTAGFFGRCSGCSAFLWHCACGIRRRSGPTTLFSTTSCVCSTHHCLHAFGVRSPPPLSPPRTLLALFFPLCALL